MSLCCLTWDPSSCQDNVKRGREWLCLGIATLVAMQSMIVSLAVNLTPPEPDARPWIHATLAISALIVLALTISPLWLEICRQWKARRLGMEWLFLSGIIGSFIMSALSSLTGYGTIYYEVVAILMAIYTLGRLLGERRQREMSACALALAKEFDLCQHIEPDGTESTRPVQNIKSGDLVRVRAGQGIPIDGILISGTGYVRETSLTGEAFPIVKRPSDTVWAGTTVMDASLVIKASHKGSERQLDRLLSRLSASPISRWQREADRIVSIFLPWVMVISLLTGIYWWHQSGWQAALFNAMSVLLVACPCAMGLATPIAVWSGLNALAKQGLLASSGDFLEQLSQINTAVFDKTGTLSEGEMTAIDLVTSKDVDRSQLLGWISKIQSTQPHPIARALGSFIGNSSSKDTISEIRFEPGIGVSATIELRNSQTKEIKIGNQTLVSQRSAAAQELLKELKSDSSSERHVWVLLDSVPVAVASLQERLRLSSQDLANQFRTLGIQFKVMTGDRVEHTTILDVKDLEAGMSAEQKADRVRHLQQSGDSVLFVGDGINDTPAMKQADASIAIQGGSSLAMESSGAVLWHGDLSIILKAISISRKVRRGIRNNLIFAGIYNSIGIILAASGVLHPIASALLMLAASVTVTVSALRFSENMNNPKPSLDQTPLVSSNPTSFLDSPYFGVLVGVSLGIQGPLIAFLGSLSRKEFILIGLLFLIGGSLLSALWPKWKKSFYVPMLIIMLSIGNCGMLLGWIIDTDFKPLAEAASKCIQCGCGGPGWISWMNSLMLITTLPIMALFRNSKFGLSHVATRWIHSILMGIGMVIGMQQSIKVIPSINIIDPQLQLYFYYSVMTLGMLVGMFGMCGLWQLINRRFVAGSLSKN